jgi:hypothetical protein
MSTTCLNLLARYFVQKGKKFLCFLVVPFLCDLSGRRDYARQRFPDSAPNKAEIMAPVRRAGVPLMPDCWVVLRVSNCRAGRA